jgi:hypothetical protein
MREFVSAQFFFLQIRTLSATFGFSKWVLLATYLGGLWHFLLMNKTCSKPF